MAILITGGAGYIGSVAVDLLRERGEEVVVLDDLRRGHREALDRDVPLYEGSVGDAALVARITAAHGIEACIHFAALAYVGESVEKPALYFRNNVIEGLGLLQALLDAGVRRFVFSSTCATYGETNRVPINEDAIQDPTNPYGVSKLFIERTLAAYDRAHGLKSICLRYFNAAGATDKRGEHHEPETHLIPLALATAAGHLPHVTIFGTDYDTPDGTAIRDYVHVQDLARAHLMALDHLRNGGASDAVNLGTGRGHSVREVIDIVGRISGRPVATRTGARRTGDPPLLVADVDKAARVLRWTPEHKTLDAIVKTAWRWMQKHPGGYQRR